jgi:hypothetical protein
VDWRNLSLHDYGHLTVEDEQSGTGEPGQLWR